MDFSLSSYVYIDDKSCVRYTFSKSHCRSCEDICPTKAIVFSPMPKIDSKMCIKCGLCYSACNFSAIRMDNNDVELLKETNNLRVVNIGCIKANSDIKITCISRLTETVLTSWVLDKKEIVINKGSCEKCKLKDGLVFFKRNLKNSLIIATAFGVKPLIKIKKNPSEKIYIPKEVVSRRDVFSGFIRKLKKDDHETKREVLVKLLMSREIKKDLLFPYIGEIEISDECNLCGVCEFVCPMNALLIKKGVDNGEILFKPSLCVNCGECVKACIKGAITVKSAKVSFFNKRVMKLFKAKKNVCIECNKEFYSFRDENICPICKNKEESKKKFVEFLKNI